MDDILVSVIMPVYKVEDYVAQAIESIQQQTITRWEFLIVDDGSPDNSGKICDEYAARDARIRVFHKENGGAPGARNLAIDRARGKYLYFMDADDWAEPAMLRDMTDMAEKNRLQLVVTGFYIDTYYSDKGKYEQQQAVEDMVFSSKEEFRRQAYRLFDRNLLYTPWNKLFLTSYIQEKRLYFPQTFWDDFPFNLSVIRDIERVGVTSRKYYHFIRKRAESETARYRADMYEKREEENRWMEELFTYWGIGDENSREFLARRYVERLVGCIENAANPNNTQSQAEKKRRIAAMLQPPRVQEYLRTARPRSAYMRLMLLPLRWESTALCYWEGRLISWVRFRSIKTFAKLKANR